MADPLPPEKRMMQMITGYWISQAIHVAAKLGLADHVENKSLSAEELAQKTGTHPHALHRLLRALASVGIFQEDQERRFGLTPLAETLLDRPGSKRAPAIMMGDEHYAAWGHLLYSIRTGKTAFDHLFGQPVFDFLANHPEEAKIFDAAMTGFHGPETQGMVDAYDFSAFKTLADIGGGNGSVLTLVLAKYPALQGILYDLPGVIERSRKNLEQKGLTDRCQAIAGSFFESVPAGADAYLLRHIIHDWNDDQCLTILGHIRKVIPPHGKLLIVEMVVQPGNEPGFVKFLDLNMMVIPGGMERTEEEYRTLFQKAGFRLEKVVPTRTDVSVVEGVPVSP